MVGTPGAVRWPGRRVGQDNEGVYGEVGVSLERLADLRRKGAI
jgi:crotonobetainyl-CoA:carnitine CoA-transferase CaiB-like acyl-CoA transferase